MKYKCPFYLSFNVSDDLLNMNRDLYYKLEKSIFDKLTQIQSETENN